MFLSCGIIAYEVDGMSRFWRQEHWLNKQRSNNQQETETRFKSSLRPHGLYIPRNSPGQNTGVGGLSLLQGIFPTRGSNPGLPHYRWILYQLSHQGSPYLLPKLVPAGLLNTDVFPGCCWHSDNAGTLRAVKTEHHCLPGAYKNNWDPAWPLSLVIYRIAPLFVNVVYVSQTHSM